MRAARVALLKTGLAVALSTALAAAAQANEVSVLTAW